MRPLTRLGGVVLAAVLAVGALSTAAQADAEIDELAVVVVGDGQTYANEAGPVAIQFLDSAGALGDAIDLPTESDGDQHAFTLGVNRDQAGALQQSADHSVLTLGGYDAPPGTNDVNGTEAPQTLRVIARVDASGGVDTSTSLAGAYSERHLRGVASVDGSRYWTGGHGNDSDDPYRAGVLTVAHGGDMPEVVTTDAAGSNLQNNTRVPVIHDDQLYVSSDRSGYHGVNRVGTGLPTAAQEMSLVAPAPAGREIPHDFAFIGDRLYVTYTEGSPALVRYDNEDGTWVESGSFPGEFWSLTGRVAEDDVVLYAVRGSDDGNELVQLLDRQGTEFTAATEHVLAVAETNTAFRGVAFAPGFEPGDGPVGELEPGPSVAWDVRVAGGAGNALSAVLGAETNPVATGAVTDPAGAEFEVEVTSGDPDVVTDEDLAVTMADDGSFVLGADPSGVGSTTLTLTVTTTDDRVGTARIAYWVSGALPDAGALAHVGMADASAAYDVGQGHVLVADDDSNQIRLFGPTFGEPVAEFDFNDVIEHVTDNTFDLEGAARIDDTIYWVGSLGNSRSGNYWPHRDIVFATDVHGSGAGTTLTYAGAATGFRQALADWDATDAHGEGADYFQFVRATSEGHSAEGPNSLNVEGATIAPDGTTLWLGFRSPLVPVAQDIDNDPDGDMALVIGIENIADVVTGDADIAVAEHFTLDLDGRAIRDLTETDDGQYLIAAGSADDSGDFALFGWSGDPAQPPVVSRTPLGLDGWPGSYEGLPGAATLTDGTTVRVLQDVGTLDIYGTGTQAQDLTRDHMKFVSHDYVLDFGAAFTAKTLELSSGQVAPGDQVGAVVTGFAAGEQITFTLNSDPVTLITAHAGPEGALAVDLAIPADAEVGEHLVVAQAGSGQAEAALGVVAAGDDPTHGPPEGGGSGGADGSDAGLSPPAEADRGGGPLPVTGAGAVGGLALLALFTVLTGLGLRRSIGSASGR